jgi:hypothetical protein
MRFQPSPNGLKIQTLLGDEATVMASQALITRSQTLTGNVSIEAYGDKWLPTVGATFQILAGDDMS